MANAQCIIFSASSGYNCLTNQASISFIYTGSGGVAPFSYTFVNVATGATVVTGSTPVNTGTINSLPPGIYIVYSTSANGCSNSQGCTVNFLPSLANISFLNTVSVTCNGGNNGSVSAIAPGSFSANPNYTWLPGSFGNTGNVTGLSGGVIYTVTIADAKGCVANETVSVNEPPPITSTLSNNFITCFGKTLNTTITSTGNVGATGYTVNGIPAVSNNAVNLAYGLQTIITGDSKGCVQTNTVFVDQEVQTLISFNITQPACPGTSDGAIISGVTNAPGAFSYTWLPGSSNNPNLNNIPSGNYSLSVLDGNGCTTKSVTAVLPAASATVTAVSSPENCSAADGSFSLNVAGVNPPFSFSTLPIGPHSSNSISNLSSGTYTTITTYNNVCIDTLKFNVGNLSTVQISVQNFVPVLCYSNCTASLSINVQNAVMPVTYSATGTGTTISNTLTNLCAGFYIIHAIDANGCPATTTLTITEPPVFSYTASAPSMACAGRQVALQGSAIGGSGGYTFVWKPGVIVGQFVNIVPAGTTVYSLNAYDSNGCTQAPSEVTVTIWPLISVNVSGSNTGICPGSTAQITPTISGGDGNFSYLWLPGNTTDPSIFVENLVVPTYSLIVNDGCGSPTVTKQVNINLFPTIKPTFAVKIKKGCEPLCTQFINTTKRSSSPAWNYGDQPGTKTGDTTFYCYQHAGVYDLSLSIIDSNSCRTFFSYPQAIEVKASPKANFTTFPSRITLKTANDVQIKNLTDRAINYNWSVDGKKYSETFDFIHTFSDTGCYKVRLVAQNLNLCLDTAEKFVCVLEDFNFFMPDAFTPNDNGLNDKLIARGTGWLDKDYVFEIYNRWGDRIFRTTDIKEGWDGVSAEEMVPFTSFIWQVRIIDTKEIPHHFTGRVMVFR